MNCFSSSLNLKLQNFFGNFLLSHQEDELKDEDSIWKKIKFALLCPPHGHIGKWLSIILVILAVYGGLLALIGQHAAAPHGILFQLFVLVIVGVLMGKVMELIRLPPLLGMIVTGIFFENLNLLEKDENVWPQTSSKLRSLALVIILLKAGLGLDPKALKKLSGIVFRLAFIPCCIETLFVGIAGYLIVGLPWTWSFLLGFVLSAVSPAVVVPSMLDLQARGYGVEKGIPTLVIAAASIDDVLAISGFTLCTAIIFKPSSNIQNIILQVPLEVFIGILAGLIWGIICIFIPSKDDDNVKGFRSCILLGGSIMSHFGCQYYEVPGAGPISILIMGFISGLGWTQYGWKTNNYVVQLLSKLWMLFQPLLFVLIGTEIKIYALDIAILGQCAAVFLIGMSVRLIASYLATFSKEITLKERIFISLAWLPKATVQAAVGGWALDFVKSKTDLPDWSTKLNYATIVLNTAVLVILVTAPLGAIAISITGPKLLKKTVTESSLETPG
ncbi:sodium/hydrogen exchanger 9B2 [Lepeophtheirus salmonis]|uniref:sodium/hydrogen exchanger 9B2 n=1 Tax=Lepeophtheirus salmonis TaxID=72036 RepID=UPI001AE2FFA7|nr:sodium/hydrogen exchanger 9B2-like [Lepeophtheirus salmonis]XP_040567435.1 sodium/hydrogen exchanger 9B2-like [Lepeophtheirus salmonis]